MSSMGVLVTGLMLMHAVSMAQPGDAPLDRSGTINLLGSRFGFVGEDDMPIKCGFPIITSAIDARETLTPPEKDALGMLLQREERQKTIVRGRFRVHYDTSGIDEAFMLHPVFHTRLPGTADQYADSVAEIANSVYAFEVDTLDYLPPPSDDGAGGGPEYDIYIKELSNVYGYTAPDPATPIPGTQRRYTSFIEIDNDFLFVLPAYNKGLPALRVTLAHEFHHAIQMGSYGYWPDGIFYYEMTSTWLEDVLYTSVNDYYQYLGTSNGHFRNPHVRFTSNDIIMYSRCVWNHYVAKRFQNGEELIRKSWENILTLPPLPAIDAALNEGVPSTTFRKAYEEWATWNLFTGTNYSSQYYPEGSSYPDITKVPLDFTPPRRTVPGTLAAFGTRYYQINGTSTPLVLPVSNFNFDVANAGIDTAFAYTVILDVNRVDETYQQLQAGLYYKLDVPDPVNWSSLGPPLVGGFVFPNPFRPGSGRLLRVTVGSPLPVPGDLTIYSSSMDLVYEMRVVPTRYKELQVLEWDGSLNSGSPAPSGIYFYVFTVGDNVMKGKFAVIRE